jgi:hypothetical protein
MSTHSPSSAPLRPSRISLAPKDEAIDVGRKLVAYRTEFTVEALQAARAQR